MNGNRMIRSNIPSRLAIPTRTGRRGGSVNPGAAPRVHSRGGFTLIELMIVIAIVAILATLTTLGVSRAIVFSKQVATKSEMAMIEVALANAAKELGNVPYIPSYITLYEDLTDGSAQDQASINLLSKMFPGAGFTDKNGTTHSAAIDWNNDGLLTPNSSATTLKADKAWVFFLGGMQKNGEPIGFAKGACPNDLNATNRKGPFFDFKKPRLNPSNEAYTYLDYWEKKKLIVYSNMSKSPTSVLLELDNPDPSVFPYRYYRSVNPAILHNNKGYQILSAGKDGVFVSGNDPSSQSGFASKSGMVGTPRLFTGYGDLGNGADDQGNFSDSLLGKPID